METSSPQMNKVLSCTLHDQRCGGMQCLQHIACTSWVRGACICTNTICYKLLMCTEQPGVTTAANQARQEEGGSVHTTF